jgi:hypothetical protein
VRVELEVVTERDEDAEVVEETDVERELEACGGFRAE